MYKPVEQIDAPNRAMKVAELAKQLDVLEGLVVGPYCVGDQITESDMALFPTFQMFLFMLPYVFGWGDILANRPHLKGWLENMEQLEPAKRVKQEMLEGKHQKVKILSMKIQNSNVWTLKREIWRFTRYTNVNRNVPEI